MPASTRTTPALSLVSARPMTARETAVRLSVKASKAHRDRLPSMEYADRLTSNARGWDQRLTFGQRQAQRARAAEYLAAPTRTIASR